MSGQEESPLPEPVPESTPEAAAEWLVKVLHKLTESQKAVDRQFEQLTKAADEMGNLVDAVLSVMKPEA